MEEYASGCDSEIAGNSSFKRFSFLSDLSLYMQRASFVKELFELINSLSIF